MLDDGGEIGGVGENRTPNHLNVNQVLFRVEITTPLLLLTFDYSQQQLKCLVSCESFSEKVVVNVLVLFSQVNFLYAFVFHKLVGAHRIERCTYAGYLVYSQATTISPHSQNCLY